MCRLLGVALSAADGDGPARLLRTFSNLTTKGYTPGGWEPGHRDGWGIAWLEKGRMRLVRCARSADESHEFAAEVVRIGRVGSPLILAHLRKASTAYSGRMVTDEYCHPFTVRRGGTALYLAHNGGIRNVPETIGGRRVIDSQFYLHEVAAARTKNPDSPLPEVLRETARSIAASHDFTALNCLLTDGEGLHALRLVKDRPRYYSLYLAADGERAVVCSEKIRLPWRMRWRAVGREEGVTLQADGGGVKVRKWAVSRV